MNHIILSIQPQWLAKILNGEKTVEIRKSVPKLPCTVWLYCTKKQRTAFVIKKGEEIIYDIKAEKTTFIKVDKANDYGDLIGNGGRVVAKFVLEKADKFEWDDYAFMHDSQESVNPDELLVKSCLKSWQLSDYGRGKDIYAWHIKNLTILDKPLALGDFQSYLMEQKKGRKPKNNTPQEIIASAPKYVFYRGEITRAPQSFQYVIPKGE